jgi:acyl carrier protein
MNDTKPAIRKFIVDNFLFGQEEALANDTSFLDQGFMDSTGVLELVAHLEKTYGIKVNEDEITPDNLDSIEAIDAYIQRKLSPASAAADPVSPETQEKNPAAPR